MSAWQRETSPYGIGWPGDHAASGPYALQFATVDVPATHWKLAKRGHDPGHAGLREKRHRHAIHIVVGEPGVVLREPFALRVRPEQPEHSRQRAQS